MEKLVQKGVKNIVLFIGCYVMFSGTVAGQESSFVRPAVSEQLKPRLLEARSVFSKNAGQGTELLISLGAQYEKNNPIGYDLFSIYYELGIFYAKLADYDNSLKTFKKCEEVARRAGDDFFFYKSYLGQGRIYCMTGKYDSCRIMALKRMTHCEKIGYTRGIIGVYNQLGVLMKSVDQGDSATFYKEKALKMAEQSGDTLEIFYAAYNLSIDSQEGKDYRKSLEYSIYAREVAENFSPYQYGLACGALSMNYQTLKDYDRALYYIDQSVDAHQKAFDAGISDADLYWVAFGHYVKGSIYNETDSLQKGLYYLKKAVAYYDTSRRVADKAVIFAELANSFLLSGNYDSARHFGLTAVDLSQQSGSGYEQMNSYLVLAKTFQKVNQPDSARWYAGRVMELSENSSYYAKRLTAAELLYDISLAEEDKEQALYYLQQVKAARDTLENEDRVKSGVRLSMEYEFDRQKQAMAYESEKKELVLSRQIERERAIQYGAFGGVLLLSLSVFGIYRNYRRKSRDNKMITEQADQLHKKNEELNELSRYKEGLSHMIIHDMKNPLNVILGLSANKLTDEENAKMIHQSASLILQLTHDIMDIQKFEEAKMYLDREKVLVKDLVRNAIDQVALLAEAKGLKLNVEQNCDPTIYADAGVACRILVNLLTNAIKYSSYGGQICIHIDSGEADRCEVTVRDQGQGIEEGQLPHVFDKFWQVYAKRSGATYSTGLGLTFCKLATEAHDGKISVASEVGKGSAFTLSLPTVSAEWQPTQADDEVIAVKENKETDYTIAELQVLLPVAEKIRLVPIYKAGEIETLLGQIECNSDRVGEWVTAVKSAVFSWNEESLSQLLNFENRQIKPSGTDS